MKDPKDGYGAGDDAHLMGRRGTVGRKAANMDDLLDDEDELAAQRVQEAIHNLGNDRENAELDRIMYDRIVNRNGVCQSTAQDVNQNLDGVVSALSENRSRSRSQSPLSANNRGFRHLTSNLEHLDQHRPTAAFRDDSEMLPNN